MKFDKNKIGAAVTGGAVAVGGAAAAAAKVLAPCLNEAPEVAAEAAPVAGVAEVEAPEVLLIGTEALAE